MAIDNILNFYEKVKEDLKSLGISSVRTKVMISLSDGPKKTKELRRLTGIQPSTLLHSIAELEKQNLVFKKGDKYILSEIGKMTLPKLIDMIKTLVVLKNNHKLWLNHEIESIPPELLMEIGDLSDSKLIESDNLDILKTHGIHAQILLDSKEIRGIFPIFHPNYIEIFTNVVTNGINIELISTENILKKTIESIDSEDLKGFKKLISENKIKVHEIKEDIKVTFTVTDKFLTLGLFSKKGMYDSTKLLVSDHNDALEWGNRLFDYYLKKAQKINLEDFEDYQNHRL